MKQQQRSRQKPAWVDNWLIRERVARWRTRDRVKDWVRRSPQRVAYWVVVSYVSLSSLVFAGVIAYEVQNTHPRMIEGGATQPTTVALPRHAPDVGPHKDLLELKRLLMEVKADTPTREAFDDYLLHHPGLADTLRKLETLFPELQY